MPFFVTIVNEISVETDKITDYTAQYTTFKLCVLLSRLECWDNRQSSWSQPMRVISDSAFYSYIQTAVWVKPYLTRRYALLKVCVQSMECFSQLYVNHFTHSDAN